MSDNLELLVFNTHLSLWEKIKLLLGYHIQVRVRGPFVTWYLTTKTERDDRVNLVRNYSQRRYMPDPDS